MIHKVMIIGATSGLGKALAYLYVKQGCQVAVTGRRNFLLEQMKQELPGLITSCFDVTADNSTQKFRNLAEELGHVDLIIYNAGFGDVSKELDWQIEQTTILTNVVGFVGIMHAAFNYFVAEGRGQIAITSSVAALRGNSWAPAYSASKAFMSNYAEGLNIKAQRMKTNIVITDIRPGFVDTKQAKSNKRFWVASPQKAARQILVAIEMKKRVAYITKRWQLIAWLLKFLPYGVYRRFL